PHEDRALAALDVKQYRYTIKTFKMVKTEKKGLKLHESVDNVEERDFNAMGLALSGGPQTKMITVGISAMEMLKAQLEAIVDNSERTELKQAYFEQVRKLQTNLEESKKKYVYTVLFGKGSDLPPDNLEVKAEELAQLQQTIAAAHREVKKQLSPIKKWASNPSS
ncbi:unnamed protein product, partial [Durusdinium trenchii]